MNSAICCNPCVFAVEHDDCGTYRLEFRKDLQFAQLVEHHCVAVQGRVCIMAGSRLPLRGFSLALSCISAQQAWQAWK